MKRKITFLIAAIAAIMLITQPVNVNGQTKTDPVVLYSETFGSADKQVAISEHTGWSATTVMFNGSGTVASHYSGSGRIYKKDASGPSSGYTGASGNSCVVHAASSGTSTTTVITITGIKISGYTSLSMSWGMNMTNGNNTSNKTEISYKIDNGSYTALSFTHPATSGWSLISGTISGTGSSLDIQIVLKTTAGYTTKYDDIKVTGTAAIPSDPTLTIATPTGGTIAVANATTPVSSGSTVAAGTSLTLSNEPSTGYSFSAWNVYKTGDQSTTVIVSNNSFTMPSYNTTVSATFTKNNYSVTLGTPEVDLTATDYDAITIEEGETESVPYGTELVLEAGSLADGKMLAWKVIKTGVSPEEDVTNDVLSDVSADAALLTVPNYNITVSGIVQELKYIVTYKANGGVGSDVVEYYSPGANVTVANNTFTRSGYVFSAWNTKDDGEGGIEYAEGATITSIAADVTLYAQWSPAWTVTLNSNASITTVEVEQTEYTSLTAPANVPDGYVYKGWTGTPSTPNIMVNTTFTPTKDTTLYAVFAKEVQEYAENTVILDGSTLPSTATTEVTTQTIRGFNYKFGIGAKSIASSGSNRFTNTAIFTPDYFYNEDGFGTGITKVEIYARESSSISATCGIKFSSSAFNPSSLPDSYDWTKTFSTVNSVYEVNYTIPNGSKYMYYQSTDKNNQVQLRITYVGPVYYTRIYPSGNITPDEDMTITTPTVISNGTVLDMGTHTLSIGAGGSLTIEDGGQLITSSSVQLTYKKGITSAAKDGGWYTISTPVHTESNTFLTPGSVENLILASEDNYDFFRYDEASHTWMNYKQSAFNLNVGQGYLYRNNGAELHFAGYNNQATSYNVALSYASTEDKLLGFNLIGNPYPQNITMSDVTVNNGGTLSGGYVLSKDGAWSADVAATIAPAQGFLVQIDKTGVTATITKPTGGSKSRANNDYIKFIVANSQHEDAAFALFEEGYGLNKIDHRNSDIPMLYIPKEGHNFAIATMADNTQSFNLNLKAKTTGKYTLTYKATGNYSYLHVIDRLTGEDVDMLMEGEYSFIASPSDAENRFIVRLEYMNGLENSENSIFAYQSGSDIIVNGEGELQIFDVMGRRILTQYVSGVETINLQSHGVYIFKLNEKTQKIVVR